MKKIWIITLFPEYFEALKTSGIVGQALRGERGPAFAFNLLELRAYSPKDYKNVDDSPYGGGAGMVIRADILKNALLNGIIKPGNYGENFKEKLHVVYTSARGVKWDNNTAHKFATNYLSSDCHKDIVFICGRYEGIDERFIEKYVDQEICIGDFILSGGEIAVMTIIDSAMRFIPEVLGNKESAQEESFQQHLLEHPQYTRPQEFEGMKVPSLLLSGHHQKIKTHQLKERIELTKKLRPDLYQKYLEISHD